MKSYIFNGICLMQDQLKAWRSYILSSLEVDGKPSPTDGWPPGAAVTISYQTGSGAQKTAEQLAGALGEAEPKESVPPIVFDRQLGEKAREEQGLTKALVKFMAEDRRSVMLDLMEDLAGLHPPLWVMAPRIGETVLHLSDEGHVMLVGRGALWDSIGRAAVRSSFSSETRRSMSFWSTGNGNLAGRRELRAPDLR